MQLVIRHCYARYKILYGDSDSVVQAQGFEFIIMSSIDVAVNEAVLETQAVRQSDLQECEDENIEFVGLPRSVLQIIDLMK